MVRPYKEVPEIAEYWNTAMDSDSGIEITFDTPKEASRKRFQMYQHRKALENQCAGADFYLEIYRIKEMYALVISLDGATLHIAEPPNTGRVTVL